MVKFTPGVVIGGVATTVAVGAIGYVAWFDYQRRNNLEFRRALLKDKRKVEKAASAQAKTQRVAQAEQLKNAVRQMQSETPPQSVEEREAYFLEQVAIGEALAARGEQFYIPAAISFFKGLQVYPQPQELLMIYQRTQPAEVVALLMEALRLSIELEGSGSSSSSGGRGSGNMRSGAVLEEIDDGEDKTSKKGSTSTTTTTGGGKGGASASANASRASSSNGEDNGNSSKSHTSASSPGAKSYVDVEYPTTSSGASSN